MSRRQSKQNSEVTKTEVELGNNHLLAETCTANVWWGRQKVLDRWRNSMIMWWFRIIVILFAINYIWLDHLCVHKFSCLVSAHRLVADSKMIFLNTNWLEVWFIYIFSKSLSVNLHSVKSSLICVNRCHDYAMSHYWSHVLGELFSVYFTRGPICSIQ